MSLVSSVLQILTVKALLGQTVAGDRVLDNPVDPLLDSFASDPRPVIAVFSGASAGKPDGKDILGADVDVELAIQIFIPEAVTFVHEDAGLTLDARNSGDLVLNLVWRQISRALYASGTIWSKLWLDCVATVEEIETNSYLFETENKNRLHAREVMLRVRTLKEPAFGEPATAWFWEPLLAALADDPDYAPVAGLIRTEIEAPAGLPAWRVQGAELGLNEAGARGLGLDPLLDHGNTSPEQDAAPLEEITLDPLAETITEEG